MTNLVLTAYLSFACVCCVYTVFGLRKELTKENCRKIFNSDTAWEFILSLIFSNFYFAYTILVLPIFILFVIMYFFEYIFKFILQNSDELGKPNLKNLKVASVADLIKLQLYYFPKINAYFFVYFIFKKKKIQFKAISHNVTFLTIAGKPMWFMSACLFLSKKILELAKSDMLKRKKTIWKPYIFLVNIIKIIKTYYFFKIVNYQEMSLKLKISIFRINGLEEFLKMMANSKNIIKFDKFKTIVLSGIPHLLLTNDEGKGGQVFTSSEWVYAGGRKVQTAEITKKQKIIFTLLKKEDVLDEPYYKTLRDAEKLDIDTPEKFIGFMYRLNLIYWSDISEKILWQAPNRGLSMVLEPKNLPITEQLIASDMDSFKKENIDPKLYLRYRFGTEPVYSSQIYDNLRNCSNARVELLQTNNEAMYLKLQEVQIDGIAVVLESLKEEYRFIKAAIDEFK